MNHKFLLISLLMFAGGCTHPIDIIGEGDVLSASGENDCLLENLPCEAVAVEEYVETYHPEARLGYEFVGWDGCFLDQVGDDCVFNVAADPVRANWFKTMPPLVAKFAPLCSEAPNDSFVAIQEVIFNGIGCAAGGCHSGNNPDGGMNLSSGNAYANIFNVNAAQFISLKRILPGNATNSYLYRKVSAKTNRGSFNISGFPMPLNGNVLSDDQLQALALWIDAGAPQFGRATELNEIEQLLGLCD